MGWCYELRVVELNLLTLTCGHNECRLFRKGSNIHATTNNLIVTDLTNREGGCGSAHKSLVEQQVEKEL